MQVEDFCEELFEAWLSLGDEKAGIGDRAENVSDVEKNEDTDGKSVEGFSKQKQAGSKDPQISNAIVENLKQRIQEMPDWNRRVVHVNLQNHDNFKEVWYEVLQQIFNDSKFSPKDTRIKRENWEHEQREEEICLRMKSVIENFSKRKIYVFLLIEHFELAAGNWNSSNYGWLRDFISGEGAKNLFALVLSDRRIREITEEPAGSSPLFNVFDQYQEVV